MKKTLLLHGILALTILSLFKCSSDDEKTPFENPVSSFMADSAGNVEDNFAGQYEIGYTFKSSKKGKVKQLGIFVPKAGTFKVTLWNTETQAKLAQTTIVSQAKKKVYGNISPIDIEANKEYTVSINTTNIVNAEAPANGGYFVIRADKTLYPVTKGSITITNNWEVGASSPTYPKNVSCRSCIIGTVDFSFQAD